MHRHSRAIRLFCWVVVTLSPMLASGVTRDQAADLGVSFMVQPNTYLLPGSVGSVIVTVTNHGPDTVSAFVVHSSIWADGQQILLFPTPETQCDFGYGSYDGPVLYYYASLLFQSAPLPRSAAKLHHRVICLPESFWSIRAEFQCKYLPRWVHRSKPHQRSGSTCNFVSVANLRARSRQFRTVADGSVDRTLGMANCSDVERLLCITHTAVWGRLEFPMLSASAPA